MTVPIPVVPQPDGAFRASAMVEAGHVSAVVARAWVTVGSTWGASHVLITALDDQGRVLDRGVLRADVPNNRRVVLEAPSGTVMVTIEGRADPGALVAAAMSQIVRDYD